MDTLLQFYLLSEFQFCSWSSSISEIAKWYYKSYSTATIHGISSEKERMQISKHTICDQERIVSLSVFESVTSMYAYRTSNLKNFHPWLGSNVCMSLRSPGSPPEISGAIWSLRLPSFLNLSRWRVWYFLFIFHMDPLYSAFRYQSCSAQWLDLVDYWPWLRHPHILELFGIFLS
jgi:hypothetical protein